MNMNNLHYELFECSNNNIHCNCWMHSKVCCVPIFFSKTNQITQLSNHLYIYSSYQNCSIIHKFRYGLDNLTI